MNAIDLRRPLQPALTGHSDMPNSVFPHGGTTLYNQGPTDGSRGGAGGASDPPPPHPSRCVAPVVRHRTLHCCVVDHNDRGWIGRGGMGTHAHTPLYQRSIGWWSEGGASPRIPNIVTTPPPKITPITCHDHTEHTYAAAVIRHAFRVPQVGPVGNNGTSTFSPTTPGGCCCAHSNDSTTTNRIHLNCAVDPTRCSTD
jgi:hypothetical protein